MGLSGLVNHNSLGVARPKLSSRINGRAASILTLAVTLGLRRSPTMESSSRKDRRGNLSREEFLRQVISPAIGGQSCPICLRSLAEDRRGTAVIAVCLHAYCMECIRRWSGVKRKCPLCNAEFDSWFYDVSSFSRNFRVHKLRPLKEEEGEKAVPEAESRSRRRRMQRTRAELNLDGRRSRPVPWRRTFGRPGSVDSRVVAERKLQWRASVYNRRLRAVPVSPGNRHNQISNGSDMKERILPRVEPWIRRELQAILQDPDPSVIVHLASSLYITSVEGKSDVHSGQAGAEDNSLAPLRPFLLDRTDSFWHELSCFAESTLTMETYDAVVQYVRNQIRSEDI